MGCLFPLETNRDYTDFLSAAEKADLIRLCFNEKGVAVREAELVGKAWRIRWLEESRCRVAHSYDIQHLFLDEFGVLEINCTIWSRRKGIRARVLKRNVYNISQKKFEEFLRRHGYRV